MHFLQCTRLAVCLAVRIFRNWSFARSLRICNFGLGMRVILAQRAAKAIRIIGCACFGFLLHRSSEVMAKSSRLRSRNQQSRLPAIKRFAKRQSAVAFKTVTCDQGLVIRGGLTKKPIFMPKGGFPGEKIHQDEQEGALVMPGSGWESKRIESVVADLAHRDLEAIG